MSSLYFLLIPAFLFVLYKRIKEIIGSVRERNHSKLKADIFFLMLTIIVITTMVLANEFI